MPRREETRQITKKIELISEGAYVSQHLFVFSQFIVALKRAS